MDYLQPYLVEDHILGHKIEPYSSGHDAWGYRNKLVPTYTDIVAIGDSQTYGVSAPAKDSWPTKVQESMHKNVYNLSLGGYGPVEYFYLLKNKAVNLKPSLVVIGFYFGNDLLDAFNATYTRDYWKYLRKDGFIIDQSFPSNNDSSHSMRRHRFMGYYRDWLAHHSILYRITTFSLGNLAKFYEMKHDYGQDNPDISILEDVKFKIHTGFRPRLRFNALNLEDPNIQEGLRISLLLLFEMHEFCSKNKIDFLIALIPTKESVFSEFIKDNNKLKNSDVIDRLVANEENTRALVKNYLVKKEISFVDVLAPLKRAIMLKVIYPTNDDGHPNKQGYEVIAKAIQKSLVEIKKDAE